eukprot:1427345-Alexandrium_andersonii.AAC.1
MSASLVGSEMCIRDRLCVACAGSSRVLSCGHVPVSGVRLRRACGCVASVSYTHLTLPTICSV